MMLLRAVIGLGVVGGVLILIFQGAAWRGDHHLLRRYCDDPPRHLNLVRRIVTEARPAGEDSRRPYIIAAKLIYLVPRLPEESVDSYIARLRGKLAETCR